MMKIIAVDDEQIALEGLLDVIREAAPEAELTGFEYPEDALEFVEEHDCTIAFLDVEMAGMSGVELAEQLKLRNRSRWKRRNENFTTCAGPSRDATGCGYSPSEISKLISMGIPFLSSTARPRNCWPIWWIERVRYALLPSCRQSFLKTMVAMKAI